MLRLAETHWGIRGCCGTRKNLFNAPSIILRQSCEINWSMFSFLCVVFRCSLGIYCACAVQQFRCAMYARLAGLSYLHACVYLINRGPLTSTAVSAVRPNAERAVQQTLNNRSTAHWPARGRSMLRTGFLRVMMLPTFASVALPLSACYCVPPPQRGFPRAGWTVRHICPLDDLAPLAA